tara:strand:+ start:366 stop:593 length:228 start_codon:yes stop_codon:yes gene_type:complete
MSILKTSRWAASVGSRLAVDIAIWTLTKVEKMGEGHLCSRLYTDMKDAATMGTIFDDIELSDLPKDHIHHDNDTV